MLHMPDGEEQQKRDRYLLLSPFPSVMRSTNRICQYGKADTEGLQLLGEKTGLNKECVHEKMIDEPSEGMFNPLTFPYVEGFDVFRYVSLWVLRHAV
jgi:hypothetical protein